MKRMWDENEIVKIAEEHGGSIEEYIKSATVSEDGNTLTLTKKDDSAVVFAPETGSELTPETLAEVLEGSETVVVDLNQEGDKLEVRLDNDIATKIDKALVIPTSAPTDTAIVAVGTGREQEQIYIGDGLTLEGTTSPYTLKASGGGGDIVDLTSTNITTASSLATVLRSIRPNMNKLYKIKSDKLTNNGQRGNIWIIAPLNVSSSYNEMTFRIVGYSSTNSLIQDGEPGLTCGRFTVSGSNVSYYDSKVPVVNYASSAGTPDSSILITYGNISGANPVDSVKAIAPPTADGTYKLQCVKSGSTITYSWVAG